MTFDWCCFVSYRLGMGKLAVGILSDFCDALSNELELQVDEKMYVSQGELKAGDILDPTLERALCRSVCMVMLFTGNYFSETHPYCAREYLAMQRLEATRMLELNADAGQQHGLIIPVVLRDLDRLPPDLRKGRVWCDFREFQQVEGGIAKPKGYFEEIRKLGDTIAARCREMRRLPDEEEDPCRQFQFPTDEEARQFMAQLDAERDR